MHGYVIYDNHMTNNNDMNKAHEYLRAKSATHAFYANEMRDDDWDSEYDFILAVNEYAAIDMYFQAVHDTALDYISPDPRGYVCMRVDTQEEVIVSRTWNVS